MERQKRGDSLTDDDDNEGSEEDDEGLLALQSTPKISCGSCGSAGLSGVDCLACAAAEESSTRKRAALSPLRGLSPKHPYTAIEGYRDSSCVAPIAPSPMGAEIPV
jgi:hypothetical protein